LPSLDDVERTQRLGDFERVVEQQQIDVPQREQRGRNVEQRDLTFVAQHRTREQQKEMQRERRQKNRRDLFDELEKFVAPVDVARGRVDVDDEREQRDEVEEPALGCAASEQCEETDGEIEEADEAEDQVRVVDL